MGWGGAGSWAGGGGAAVADPVVVIEARAERWACEQARERGEDVTGLELRAQAAESAAWRYFRPEAEHGSLGGIAAESVAWRREQEQGAAGRGQLGAYLEVYGRSPAGITERM